MPFKTTCNRKSRSASTPNADYNTETGIGAVGPTPDSMQDSGFKFYQELWFMALMAGVGLVLLGVFLGLLLNKMMDRPVATRERPPLVPLQIQKGSPMANFPSSNFLFDSVPDDTNPSNTVTLKGFTMRMEEVLGKKVTDDGDRASHISVLHVTEENKSPSHNSLHRSISQLLDKSMKDDELWDSVIHGHDSGLFMEDEEFVETIKGFSTVRKEHTMFTDTNL